SGKIPTVLLHAPCRRPDQNERARRFRSAPDGRSLKSRREADDERALEARVSLVSRPRSVARIISIGGGKGGVGKSIVAANLSAVIARAGKRVVLADLDLGAANQHLLLGIDQPKGGIDALLGKGSNDDVTGALSDTPIPNLKLLAGSGASVGAANISHG